MSQAFMVSLLILFLFLGELFLASFVAPALPSTDIQATPTLSVLNETEGVISSDPAIALTLVTPIANLLPSSSDTGCVPGEIILTVPEPGQQVSGVVTLVGTVDVDNFGFYKYEVAQAGAENWATISAGRKIIENGDVGLWDTSTLIPGDYQLRLEVTDNKGKPYPPCIIPVRVIAPSP